MARQYRNPPIVEATFETHFEPGQAYGIATAARLYEELVEAYPAEPKVIYAGNVEIASPNEGDDESTVFRMRQNELKNQFASLDGRFSLRFNRTSLSIHALAPYPGWSAFRERITEALEAYIGASEPQAITRMSVRYVNQILLGTEPVDLNDYFTNPPDLPSKLEDVQIGAFFLRMESVWQNEPVKLVQSFASAPGDELAVILDLDVIKEDPIKIDGYSEELMAGVDHLRDLEREAFEALITEKLRERFDAR